MKSGQFCTILLCIGVLYSCSTQIESDWKGPQRNGIYHETGLLKEWSGNGPELLWRYDSLQMGHSSPAVTNDAIYLTGMPDSTTGILYCLDLEGNLLWKVIYGEEYKISYTGSRSTPVVTSRELYLMSGAGEIICYDIKKREKKWSIHMIGKYSDSIPKYGHAQSILIAGNKLYCTPGGEEFNVICLHRKTGELIWSSRANGEPATYSSPILINRNGHEILVTVTNESIVGISANNGNLLWSIPYKPLFVRHVNTPVYYGGKIYMATDAHNNEGGIISIALNDSGTEAQIHWERNDIRNLLNGFIVHDNLLFTPAYRKKDWQCLDAETGQTIHTWTGYVDGTLTYADGLFYVLANDGEVRLCRNSETGFNTISSFNLDISIYYPFAPLWAFPVIKNKRLYIRHKGSLFAYNISSC
jgi:outer membrane protein assembly factor BamB